MQKLCFQIFEISIPIELQVFDKKRVFLNNITYKIITILSINRYNNSIIFYIIRLEKYFEILRFF